MINIFHDNIILCRVLHLWVVLNLWLMQKKDSNLQQQSYPGHQHLDLHLVLYVHRLP